MLGWGKGGKSVWGNDAFCLKPMASWGFVIIAPQDKNAGPGQTMLDGVNFLIAANSNPVSIFFHKLNVNQVGSFEHSQGTGGAIKAIIKYTGKVKTEMPIKHPSNTICSFPIECPNTPLPPITTT